MDTDTINKLLISLDTIVESQLEEAILTDADQTKVRYLLNSFKEIITNKLHNVQLKTENDPSLERVSIVQNEIMTLENELQALTTEIETYRQCAQQQLSESTGRVCIDDCIDTNTNRRNHSSCRRELQQTIGKDIQNIVSNIETGVVAALGNEVRRTQKTVSVIMNEKDKGLSKIDQVIASVHFIVY